MTLSAMFNLGRTLHHLEEFSQAQLLLMPVLRIRKQFFGPDHPDTLAAGDRARGRQVCWVVPGLAGRGEALKLLPKVKSPEYLQWHAKPASPREQVVQITISPVRIRLSCSSEDWLIYEM
jgi:hypothetical protein